MRAPSLIVPLTCVLLTSCGRIDFDAVTTNDDDAGPDAAWPTLEAQWTWIGGSRFKDALPSYGVLDVESASNNPGSRDNGGMWVVGDELWLFGGLGFAEDAGFGGHADLWSYSLATGLWTWRGGARDLEPAPVFGTLFVPDAGNQPAARNDPAAWSSDGSLWMFGGSHREVPDASRGDLWRYDLALRQWVWMGGTQGASVAPMHGTLGQADGANMPGSRDSAAAWGDATGFWLYGGSTTTAPETRTDWGDLWRFDYSTNQWTWVGGSSSPDPATVRGTRGVPSPSNQPRRGDACALGDALGGELWMIDQAFDVWRYTVATGAWTWIAGPGTEPVATIHGELDVTAPTSRPGTRRVFNCWLDLRGNIWAFGGLGLDGAGTMGELNDTWVYQPDVDRWTWIAGASVIDQSGVYGELGVPASANTPGARLNSAKWVAPDGALWMFGGDYATDVEGIEGEMNDLWRLAAPP